MRYEFLCKIKWKHIFRLLVNGTTESVAWCMLFRVSDIVKFLFVYLSLLCIYALFGDISFFFQDNVVDALIAFLTSGNVIWILTIMPYVAGVAYYLSYRVSLKVYRKGAESYGE